MMDRIGNWMQTATGVAFYVLDPRTEEVCIEDIAHALSMLCRFGGHVSEFYSVAQHSVLVARAVSRHLEAENPSDRLGEWRGDPYRQRRGGPASHQAELVLWALLHDAAEAYAGDIIWPLKRAPEMSGYGAIEKRLQDAILDRFSLPRAEPPIVKHFDLVLLATEKRDLMGGRGDCTGGATLEAAAAKARTEAWHCDVVLPLERKIVPWEPEVAKREFLGAFRQLSAIRSEGASDE